MFAAVSCPKRLVSSRGILRDGPYTFRYVRSISANALAAKVFKTLSGIETHIHLSFDQARIAETDLKMASPPPLRDTFGRMHNYLRISACPSSQPTLRSVILNKYRPDRTV